MDPLDQIVLAIGNALDAAPTSDDDPMASLRRGVAIAYSGGADSTALLHAAAMMQRAGRIDVIALHVHHGIAAAADAWLDHCIERADAFGVGFAAAHVGPLRSGVSIEAEARTLRYAALTELCREHGCSILMTAHHVDDQAETVLVNLARGAGVGGLAATARSRWIDDVLLLRPLIDLPASTLRASVEAHALTHVVDPSNNDRRHTRNAIRHEVMPALRRIVPTIATRLAQTAAHASTMQRLLDDIGREDLREPSSSADDDLDVEKLAVLSAARAANALRVWIARHGMRAPSAATLQEMLDQLLHASPGAQIALLHEKRTLRAYRGRVSVDAGGPTRAGFVPLEWRGEARLDVPAWRGSLVFETAVDGDFDAQALREGRLAIRERRGGERLRTHVGGPGRTLKNLYQEAGIAPWQRARLPLVYLDGQLIYAAAIGPNAGCSSAARAAAPRVRISWRPDEAGRVPGAT